MPRPKQDLKRIEINKNQTTMKNIFYHIRFALKPRMRNIIPVISLVIGLTFALILFGNVTYQYTFDSHIAHTDRMFSLSRDTDHPYSDAADWFYQVPDVVVPTFVAEIPEIEMAVTTYGANYTYVHNGKDVFIPGVAVDKSFIDVFAIDILSGDPSVDLKDKNTIYLSDKYAIMLFGDVEKAVGQTLKYKGREVEMTVRGVFEAMPENTTFWGVHHSSLHAILSSELVTLSDKWDARGRGYGFIVLREGADKARVEESMQKILSVNYAPKQDEKMYNYKLTSCTEIVLSDQAKSAMILISMLLGVVLVVVAALNYSLIALSGMSLRLKEFAVHKCAGAKKSNIAFMIFVEVSTHVVVALGISALIILGMQDVIAMTLMPIDLLFSGDNLWISGVVVLFVTLISTIIPSIVFAKIPVMSLFRSSRNSHKAWKKIMIFLQLTSSVIFIYLAISGSRQYSHIVGLDLGYDYEQLATVNISSADSSELELIRNGLMEDTNVEGFALCSQIPMYGHGRLDVMDQKDKKVKLFSTISFAVDSAFFDVFGLNIIEGKPFTSNNATEVVVNKQFIETMNWDQNKSSIGLTVNVHGRDVVVVGVVENFSAETDMYRKSTSYAPLVLVNKASDIKWFSNNTVVVVKLRNLDSGSMQAVDEVIKSIDDDYKKEVVSYTQLREWLLDGVKRPMDSIGMGAMLILLICTLGIYGYVSNELQFKHREIALRKVYGASIPNIILMIYRPIFTMVWISLLVGVGAAYYGNHVLMSMNFADVAPTAWWIFGALILFVIGFSLLIVSVRSYRVANANPIKAIHE